METPTHLVKTEGIHPHKKGLQRIASAVSVVSHPLFMPFLGILAILYHLPYYSLIAAENKHKILLIGFVLTAIVPMVFIVLMRFLKLIASFSVSNQRERLIPLIISSITLYYTYTFFKDYQSLNFISYYLLSCSVASVLATIINFFWKISLHSIGLGGIFALYAILNAAFASHSHAWVLLIVLAFGLVGSARLYLQEHSLGQYIIGFFVGIFSIVVVFASALV